MKQEKQIPHLFSLSACPWIFPEIGPLTNSLSRLAADKSVISLTLVGSRASSSLSNGVSYQYPVAYAPRRLRRNHRPLNWSYWNLVKHHDNRVRSEACLNQLKMFERAVCFAPLIPLFHQSRGPFCAALHRNVSLRRVPELCGEDRDGLTPKVPVQVIQSVL